jgi:CheY-like chemotaxis protein
LKIILAEDNAVNQFLAVRLLEKRRHAAVVAETGKAALEALEKQTFDLVLMGRSDAGVEMVSKQSRPLASAKRRAVNT